MPLKNRDNNKSPQDRAWPFELGGIYGVANSTDSNSLEIDFGRGTKIFTITSTADIIFSLDQDTTDTMPGLTNGTTVYHFAGTFIWGQQKEFSKMYVRSVSGIARFTVTRGSGLENP